MPASRWTSTRWRASSCRGWTPGWTSAWRRGVTGCGCVRMGRPASSAIDVADGTDKPLPDGVALFGHALDKLLAGVESKREAVTTGRPETFESMIPDELEPAIADRVKKAASEDVA